MNKVRVKKIIPYLIIAILSAIVLIKPFGSGDELWNYNFARNIVNGMVPYRDFSIIQTPLSAYVPALFMKIFGQGLFVHRVVGYLLLFALVSVSFHICKRITGVGIISFVFALLVFGLHLLYYIYNYNYLSAFVILIILELELGCDDYKPTRDIIIGLLVGLLPLIKQSTGAVLLMANFAVVIFNVLKFGKSKRNQALRFFMSLVPSAVFVALLVFEGAWNDFLEYAVRGLRTFTHRFTLLDLIKSGPAYLFFVILIIVAYIMIGHKIWKSRATSEQVACLIFCTSWLMIAYPLCDASHLMCFIIPLVPVFLLFIQKRTYKRSEQYVCAIVAAVVCAVSVFSFLPDSGYMLSTIKNYEMIVISKPMNECIEQIDDYIMKKQNEGYIVRIADDSSSAYKIPLNSYEKNWDMLLIGNLGDSTIEELLETSEKCLYLVYKDTNALGMQNHFQLIEYIQQNYNKVEEVLYFDVYEKQGS